MHRPVFNKPGTRAYHLYGTIERSRQMLRQRDGIAEPHAHRREGIHRRAVHGDDVAVRGDHGVVRVDLRHAPVPHDVLESVGIRPRRSAVGAVVDDEVVLAALGIDARDGQRRLIDLHRAVIGRDAEDKGAVLHDAERRTVKIRRADNASVDLRHADELAAWRKIGCVDRGDRVRRARDAAHRLPSGDIAARKRGTDAVKLRVCREKIRRHETVVIFVDMRRQLQSLREIRHATDGQHTPRARIGVAEETVCAERLDVGGLFLRRRIGRCRFFYRLLHRLCRGLFHSLGRNVEVHAERIRQISDLVLHPLRHRDGHVKMPVSLRIGNRLNALCADRRALHLCGVHIGKVERQLASVL